MFSFAFSVYNARVEKERRFGGRHYSHRGAGNDVTLQGQDGDDTINGGDGDDSINGGLGNDLLISSQGDDIMNGKEDIDTVSYAGDAAGVTVDTLNGTATDGWGDTDTLGQIENIIGSAYADLLIGNNADGNDIRGGDGADNIQGRNGDDILYGDAGADLIYGGSDNDTIYGGLGQDVLRGQAGDDTFVLEAATAFDGTFDILKDYSLGDDALDISDIINFDPLSDVLADFVDVRTSGAHTIIAVDQDGTGGYTDVVRIDGAASVINDLSDFTTGDNLIIA